MKVSGPHTPARACTCINCSDFRSRGEQRLRWNLACLMAALPTSRPEHLPEMHAAMQVTVTQMQPGAA